MARQVAEWSLMMTLNGLRELNRSAVAFGAGSLDWQNKIPGKAIQESTIGICGYGDISRHLIEMLKPLKPAKILIQSNYLKEEEADAQGLVKADFETIFAESDVIHLLSSLTEKNIGMIGKTQLDLIQDNTCLINAGRAKLINQEALYASLAENRYMAAFDVFYEEPLPATDPLHKMANVMMTAHTAGQPGRSCYVPEILKEVDRFYAGEPLLYEISRERASTMTNSKLVKS